MRWVLLCSEWCQLKAAQEHPASGPATRTALRGAHVVKSAWVCKGQRLVQGSARGVARTGCQAAQPLPAKAPVGSKSHSGLGTPGLEG